MEVTFKIPTSWDDITLKMMQNYKRLDNKEATEIHRALIQVSCFCGVTMAEAKSIHFKEFSQIARKLSKTISKPLSPIMLDRIKLGEVDYGLEKDFNNLSFGAWADIDTMLSASQDDPLKFAHKIMAIIYRPIVKEYPSGKYKIKKYTGKEDASAFLEMPYEAAEAVSGFFLLLEMILSKRMMLSIQRQKKMEMVKVKMKNRVDRIGRWLFLN